MKNKIFFICLVVMMLFVTGCKNTEDPNKIRDEIHKENERLTDKITSEAYQLGNGTMIAIAQNNNDIDVDIEFEIEFYDKNNQFLSVSKDFSFGVSPKKEIVAYFYDVPENYDHFKLYSDATKSQGITFFDKVELTHSNSGKEILVQAKNTTETVIDTIKVGVVYYKEEKPIGYTYSIESSVKPQRMANFELEYPKDKNYQDIQFDSYKVFLNAAESFVNLGNEN